MKEADNEAMFELVREVPTELSKEKVMEIIGTLPTLPPPSAGSWFHNINLNSIIMTTTTVAIITSAVIYFSSPKAESPVPGQDPVSPAITEQTDSAPSAITIDDSLEAITTIPQPAIASTLHSDSIEKLEIKSVAVLDDKSTTDASPIENVPTPDSLRPGKDPNPQALGQNLKSSESTATQPRVSTPEPTRANSVSANAQPVQPEAGSKKARGMDDLKLKRLKRTLLRELSKDLLIKSKRGLNVLHFKEGEILVNNRLLEVEEFIKYSELLFKFRIEPGPEKRIVTDPKFVMVGSFTERGFKGSMHGRAVDLKFVNDAVILNGLLSDSSKGPQGITLMDVPETEVKPGDVLLSVEGKDRQTDVNLSLLNRLMSDSLGLPGFGDQEFETLNFKNAATISTIFDSGIEDIPVKINSGPLKSFKRELYKMLVNDGQIATKNSPVSMIIKPSLYKVNDNEAFSNLERSRYARLFQKYRVSPAISRKILMNKDFILVGDFNNGQFSGTAQGTIDKEKVKGTVLEEEINRSKMFGGSDEPPTATEDREVAPFNRLQVEGLAVVYLRQGAHRAITIDVTGVDLEDVVTESQNGLLKVSTADLNVSNESIAVHVTSPDVHSIWVDGAAEVFSQGMFETDILKLISKGSGAIEMAVDVNRLHLQMDGGDIHLEGKADMEKIDFYPDSDRGTLDQSGLNVIENWTYEGGQTWSEQDLPELRQTLLAKLITQGYVSTMKNPASIRFANNSMTVNGQKIASNYIEEYSTLYKAYGLPTHEDSRLWIDPDFMVIAEKEGKFFELEVMGTELELNIEGSWRALENAILHRQ